MCSPFVTFLDLPPKRLCYGFSSSACFIKYKTAHFLFLPFSVFVFCFFVSEIVPVKWHREMFTHTLEGPDDMTGHVKVTARRFGS